MSPRVLPVNLEEDERESRIVYALFRSRGIRLSYGYSDALVLLEDRRIIGAAALAADNQDSTVEFSLVTSPRRERQGHGIVLVRHVLSWARENVTPDDEGHVRVWAEIANPQAMYPMLARLGFRPRSGDPNIWERSIQSDL